jgi:hypothetical protein
MMINWQFALLQSLLDNWKEVPQDGYKPSEEELAALEWFLDLSELSEYDRLWLVQVAEAVGMQLENLVKLKEIGEIIGYNRS